MAAEATPSPTRPTTPMPANLYGPIVLCVVLLALSTAVFTLVPSIDLSVSSWFYAKDGGFYLSRKWPMIAIRSIGIWITIGTIVALIAIGLWWHANPAAAARWPTPTPRQDWAFMTAGMALGPGLLVNLIFKPIWGRPRPVHIEQFGGHDHFTPAWVISHQCSWNCSFISGEAAASAFILAFCFIVPARWRQTTFLVASAIAVIVSLTRIAVGGHFLSDVVTAWLFIALLLFTLRAQIYYGVLLGPMRRWWPG